VLGEPFEEVVSLSSPKMRFHSLRLDVMTGAARS
jgi:hypothetical protein